VRGLGEEPSSRGGSVLLGVDGGGGTTVSPLHVSVDVVS